jgi:CubicO group peptidase (beta-lactamase class C family)
MLLRLAVSIALLSLTASAGADPTDNVVTSYTAAQQGDPVERAFQQWLNAFNSNDPAIIKAFYAQYLDDPDPVFAIENAQDSCGLTVDRIVERSSTSMTVLLRQRCLPGLQRAKIELATPDGDKLKAVDIVPLALPGDGGVRAAATITSRLAARDGFAGSLIVARGDKMLLARSWGLANPGLRTPMTLDTPMFLASAGKMFTGVAVLQLVDAGKVDLDAPLGHYLIDYPNAKMAKVTIRQLLTHRGGTGDIGILGREDGANRAKVRTISDIVQLNGSRPPDFPPGSKEDYSNYGFILLGAVIEKVTGGSYYDYVAEHVFKPAGMKNAGFPDHDHLQGVAVGYTRYYDVETRLVPNLDVLPWRGASAGGGVASPNDMLRFFRALKAGKLLSPAMFKLATTPGDTPWYGMGFVAQAGEHPSWGHGGNSYGMDVAVHNYARNDTSFICMAARDSVCNRIIFAYYFRTFGP